jgi:hypothetical protein
LYSKLIKVVLIIDINSGLIIRFISNSEAVKHLNISEWTIRRYKKSKKKIFFKYKVESDDTTANA